MRTVASYAGSPAVHRTTLFLQLIDDLPDLKFEWPKVMAYGPYLQDLIRRSKV
jgi:hypothetical protein